MSAGGEGLDLADPVALTVQLVDIESVSGAEAELAAAVATALSGRPHLEVLRDGAVVVARSRGAGEASSSSFRSQPAAGSTPVILAGHLDTVPVAQNVPARRSGGRIYGCGASDMKAGLAVMLHLAASDPNPGHPTTFVFYDCEEVEATRNGLARIARTHPDWLAAGFAVLLEPTAGRIEAGCQGTLRVRVQVPGRRAHTARAWLGENAIHRAGQVLTRLADYQPREVTLDGCTYREGLSAVGISGGVAGNVVPDACTITLNYRFAPDRDVAAAAAHVAEIVAPFDAEVVDAAAGALPGLAHPAGRHLVELTGAQPVAKLGWTDVARFAALGIPALNYGPGDPNLAHTPGEWVSDEEIPRCAEVLRRWLRTPW